MGRTSTVQKTPSPGDEIKPRQESNLTESSVGGSTAVNESCHCVYSPELW